MKSTKTYFLIFISIFFSGCSWQEYFVLINNTESNLFIIYEIERVNGFAIFENTPSIYKLTKSEEIDWENKLSIKDEDTSKLVIKLTLPPKSILQFGTLNNDHYLNKDQKFINNRIFNLKTIKFFKNKDTTTLSKQNFDKFFKKENGYIKYRVK